MTSASRGENVIRFPREAASTIFSSDPRRKKLRERQGKTKRAGSAGDHLFSFLARLFLREERVWALGYVMRAIKQGVVDFAQREIFGGFPRLSSFGEGVLLVDQC